MRIHGQILLLLGLAGLLPLVVYGSFAAHSARHGSELTVAAFTATVATQVSARVDSFVRGRVDVVEAAAAACHQSAPGEIRELLTRIQLSDSTLRYLVLYNAKGNVLEHSLLPPSGISERVSGAARDALLMKGDFVTPLSLGEDPVPVMAVAALLDLFGQPEGVLVAEVDTVEIANLVSGMTLGQTGYAYVLDTGGRLIAHGDPKRPSRVMAEERDPLPPMVDALGSVRPGGLIYRRSDGTSVLGAASAVPDTNLIVVVEMPSSEAFASARRVGLMLAIILALSVGVGILLSLYGARRVARPIENLAQAASALGAGRFDVRVDEARGDEIGDMGRIFNRMAVDLERVSSDIRRHERQSFFGRIAGGLTHDLKRPFQHIITHMRTFLAMPGDPRARELVEQALDREQAYVNRLFGDLARFSTDEGLEPQSTSLPELVTRVKDSLLPAAEAAGATIEAGLDARVSGPMHVDPLALERAIRNLIENSIDALSLQDGGRIEVNLVKAQEEIRLEVRDDGPGIDPKLMPVLFDAFRTTRRAGAGLGLGLAVVRRIAEAHGGRVTAENLPEGGALMTIVLPGDGLAPRDLEDPPLHRTT